VTYDAKNKKKVMIMQNVEKIRKQNSLSSEINKKSCFFLAGLAIAVGLIHAFGATISTLLGIYLGYKLLKLIMRIFGLVLSLFLFIVLTVIQILILLLLIF
jgi:hypothetical protein